MYRPTPSLPASRPCCARVDGAEQAAQVLPDARGSGAEHVAAVAAPGDVVAQPAQRIVIVAAVVDWQQGTVFGIEDEQQAIQHDQRGVVDVVQCLPAQRPRGLRVRSEEHTSELQSLMRISY